MRHTPDEFQEIRMAIRALCGAFPDEYFREVDAQRGYPEKFVDALMKAGWLAAMIPEEYGGSGLGLGAATVIMEEINRCGGNSGAVHGQMYNMGTLLRNGSAEQNARYLPRIACGELRIQSMAVTEPTAGTDTRFGFACEYDIERKFRETRLYQVAPISTNMIFSYVAEHLLGMPRSF